MENQQAAPAPEQTNTPQEQPQEAPKKEQISPHLARLAQQERAMVAQKKALEAQKAEWHKQKAEWEAKIKEREEWEDLVKKNPLKALSKYGHNYSTLTEQQLAGGEDEMTPAMLARQLEDLKNEQKTAFERLQQEKEQEAKAQEQAAIDNFKGELKEFVSSNSEKFGLTAQFDPEAGLIYDTVDAYYQQTGKVLSMEEAAGLVEQYFDNELETAIERKYPHLKDYFKNNREKKAEAPKEDTKKMPVESGFTSKTITNQLSSSVPSMLPAKTENERLQRAMAALNGTK